jgi:hypothetical protein
MAPVTAESAGAGRGREGWVPDHPLLTTRLAYEMSTGTARGRSRVTTERWVDFIELAMMVSVSLMGVDQFSFDRSVWS